MAVMVSTSGYCGEMAAPQSRQRPRNASQPKIGILSNQRMGCLQAGQWEPGLTRLIRAGRRYTTTFRKLPTTPPTANSHAAVSHWAWGERVANIGDGP